MAFGFEQERLKETSSERLARIAAKRRARRVLGGGKKKPESAPAAFARDLDIDFEDP